MSGYSRSDLTERMAILAPAGETGRLGNTGPTDQLEEDTDEPLTLSVRSKGPGKQIRIHGLEGIGSSIQPQSGDLHHFHGAGELDVVGVPDLIGLYKQKCLTVPRTLGLGGSNTETQVKTHPEECFQDFSLAEEVKVRTSPAPLPLKKRSHSRQQKHPPYRKNRTTHEEMEKADLNKLKIKLDDSEDIPPANKEMKRLMETILEFAIKNQTRVRIGGVPHSVTATPLCSHGTGTTDGSDTVGDVGTCNEHDILHGAIDRPPPASSVSSITSASDVSEYDYRENYYHRGLDNQPSTRSGYQFYGSTGYQHGGHIGVQQYGKQDIDMSPEMGAMDLNADTPTQHVTAPLNLSHSFMASSCYSPNPLNPSEPLDLSTQGASTTNLGGVARDTVAFSSPEVMMETSDAMDKTKPEMETKNSFPEEQKVVEPTGPIQDGTSQGFTQTNALDIKHMNQEQIEQLNLLLTVLRQQKKAEKSYVNTPVVIPQPCENVSVTQDEIYVSNMPEGLKCLPILTSLGLTDNEGTVKETKTEKVKWDLNRKLKSKIQPK